MFRFLQTTSVLIIFFLSGYAYSIGKNKLINLNDVKSIFETDLKQWNQNVVFFEKKQSMEKMTIENKDSYILKSYFIDGYVTINPNFESSKVKSLIIEYVLEKLTKQDAKKIQNHFDTFASHYCNDFFKSPQKLTIYLHKC
tara:strand:- start:169 stop:591 length:423 start_codon:yes stop_codon:yes gene_type:complete